MTHVLPRPPGDPDRVDAVVKKLRAAAADLKSSTTKVKGAAGMAITGWDAPNVKSFTSAAAGIQWQLTASQSAAENAANALAVYSKVLRGAQDEVDRLQRLADAHDHSGAGSGVLLPGSTATTNRSGLTRPASSPSSLADLESQASEQVRKVKRSAHVTTALVVDINDSAVPHSQKLSAAQIARKVSDRDGAAVMRSALASGSLTPGQAWKALKQPGTEIPDDAVNSDGSINDKQFNVDLLEGVEGSYGDEHRSPLNPNVEESAPWAVVSSARLLEGVAGTRQRYFPPQPPPKGESIAEWAKKHPVEAGATALGIIALVAATAGYATEAGLAGSGAVETSAATTLGRAAFWLGLPSVALDVRSCISDIKRNTAACVAAGFGAAGSVLSKLPDAMVALRGGELSFTPILISQTSSLGASYSAFIIDGQSINSEMLERAGK